MKRTDVILLGETFATALICFSPYFILRKEGADNPLVFLAILLFSIVVSITVLRKRYWHYSQKVYKIKKPMKIQGEFKSFQPDDRLEAIQKMFNLYKQKRKPRKNWKNEEDLYHDLSNGYNPDQHFEFFIDANDRILVRLKGASRDTEQGQPRPNFTNTHS